HRQSAVILKANHAACFLLFCGSLQAAMIGPATAPVSGVAEGELLIGEVNCVACHQASAEIKGRLFSRQSPRLSGAGLRLTPQFLRAFLSNPSAEKPGTTMPDLL